MSASRVKRTSADLSEMSANDPKRTSAFPQCENATFQCFMSQTGLPVEQLTMFQFVINLKTADIA